MLIAKNIRQFSSFFLLATIIVCSYLISILPDFFLHGIQQVNEQVHSFIEGFGAMAAISMSLLLLKFHQDGHREKGEFFLLSMGFLTMGILDVFVAVSISDQGFDLLHSFRSICGSIWFVLVWLPGCGRYLSKIKAVPWIVASVSVLAGFMTLHFREFFPVMVLKEGFAPLAIQLNIVAGGFLFATAVYFFLEFLRSSTTDSYLFTCVFVLLGLPAYGFHLCTIWTEDWWFWHVQRLLAYIVMFYYMFKTFYRISNELKNMNKTLEQQVTERTAELSREVEERKRYGNERDKVIIELQDAFSCINTLTGLLPICASCKKIRDSEGSWEQLELYIQKHSDAQFSHGICPDCTKKLYPDFCKEILNDTASRKHYE
jgi:hypothetical protein